MFSRVCVCVSLHSLDAGTRGDFEKERLNEGLLWRVRERRRSVSRLADVGDNCDKI